MGIDIDTEQLKKDIEATVEDKVNEIFHEFQNKLYIKGGDIEPFETIELDQIQRCLTNLIYKIILLRLGISLEDDE